MSSPLSVSSSQRAASLPYGRHSLDLEDIQAVVAVLTGDWLTTGPAVSTFEESFARRVGARHAVAVSSGTAALHAMMAASAIGPGDEVVVPTISFVATANAVVMQGARPVFADVDERTLLVDPADVERKVGTRTRAIVAVDYAGQPCDYDALQMIGRRRGVKVLADGCHALGATYHARSVGTLAELTAFSFHPVKHITAGEGGCVTTDDADLARRMCRFRNHGVDVDYRARDERGTWRYQMLDLGYNYRLTDFQCALATSQLTKLDRWIGRRRELAARYDAALKGLAGVQPLQTLQGRSHAHHLYVIQLSVPGVTRDEMFARLRAEGIGVNVHYLPIHLQPFYRQRFDTQVGDCPCAEASSERILTLPLFPKMDDRDIDRVVNALCDALSKSETV